MMVACATPSKIHLFVSFLLLSGFTVAGGYLSGPGSPPQVRKDSKGTITGFIERKLAEGKRPNRLINEKSPYLLQHAFNPVDWYPWGEEAFEKARTDDKPIFLSIGYSTCYWCHVMEREVFENDSIAALMNKYVVNIKVDREERPDVDRVYMSVLQAMTGSGGWPMSIFLTPDLKPFFGATYIPPEAKYGRHGFPAILTMIHNAWTTDRREILSVSQRVEEFLKQTAVAETKAVAAGKQALNNGFQAFANSYDSVNGGFSPAPKFPRPATFTFLLRYFNRVGEKQALDMTLFTLRRMARGGVYDQIGGGFHRYATDEEWHVPHFEKMLYDQAQLVISYLEAYQITKDEEFAGVARDVLHYVRRSLTHPEGAFYSAEDAESATDRSRPDQKKEGAFYTWVKKDIDQVLSAEEAKVVNYRYGVLDGGNVKADPHQEFTGENILYAKHTVEETAEHFKIDPAEVRKVVSEASEKLLRKREQRPVPHLDDKTLVSWNGLMISAYARAHQVLEDGEYLTAASRAAEFLLGKLYDESSGVLLRRYRDGEARYEAHLEDYAFFIQGLLDLYEASLDIRWLKSALRLTQAQNNLFYDLENGGFYDISGNDKSILVRTKEVYDSAEPTGNAIAIMNLLRLSQMTDNQEFRKMAESSLAYFGERLLNMPQIAPQMLAGLDFSLSKPKQIIIAGRQNDARTESILKEVHARFIPNKVILLADGGEGQKTLASYVPFIESVGMIDGKATAYICEDYTCDLPTSEVQTVAWLLDAKRKQ